MRVSAETLSVVITGMEYSGTTLLGSLLNASIPDAKGAFECGLLLADSPHKFIDKQPFYKWFCTTEKIGHWGLSPSVRDKIVSQRDFQSAYILLTEEYSNVIDKKISKVIDKTPAYSFDLANVSSKIKEDVPILITYKDTLTLYNSYKKRKRSIVSFIYWILKFISSIKAIIRRKNIKIISHSSMTKDPIFVLKQLSTLFPNIQLNSQESLNFKLNPLKKEYNFEEEYKSAREGLNFIEKLIIKTLDRKLNRLLAQLDII